RQRQASSVRRMTGMHRSPATGRARLLGLTLVTFVFGTDDFIIAGILPEIARDQQVSEAAAGQLVTVFSITYALVAPPLAVTTARLPRKPLQRACLVLFPGPTRRTALAPGLDVAMALRVSAILVAVSISHDAIAMHTRTAGSEQVGRALGMVAAGLTITLFVRVPIG